MTAARLARSMLCSRGVMAVRVREARWNPRARQHDWARWNPRARQHDEARRHAACMIDDDALVGGREARAIVIADYDPAWPERFALERARIVTALGARAVAVEHVGSTAVPGLAAKPIVDVLVAVADPEADELRGALEAAGYELRVREPGHRMFRTPTLDVHVH